PPEEVQIEEAIPELPDRGLEISFDWSEEAELDGMDEMLAPRRVIDRHAGYYYYHHVNYFYYYLHYNREVWDIIRVPDLLNAQMTIDERSASVTVTYSNQEPTPQEIASFPEELAALLDKP